MTRRWPRFPSYDIAMELRLIRDKMPNLRPAIRSDRVHYRGGLAMPSHYHDEACLVLVLSGSVRHTQLGRNTELPARSVLYLPPSERHADVFGRVGADCIVIRIDQGWILQRLGTGFEGLLPRFTYYGQLYPLIITIHRELSRPDDLSMLLAEGSLLEIFARWKREQTRRLHTTPRWLELAKTMLTDCCRTRVSLRDISRAVSIHPAQLVREFHRAYGITPGAYLRKLRIEFVLDRLHSPSKGMYQSLADLAYEAGFSSHAHMTVAFKRITGLSPSEFRSVNRLKSSR